MLGTRSNERHPSPALHPPPSNLSVLPVTSFPPTPEDNGAHGFWFIPRGFLFASIKRYMCIFSLTRPLLVTQTVACCRCSLSFDVLHLAIIPRNQSPSVNRKHPLYVSWWRCSRLCVDVPALIQLPAASVHLSRFPYLQLQTILRWLSMYTSYCWDSNSGVNSRKWNCWVRNWRHVTLLNTFKCPSTAVVPAHSPTSRIWEHPRQFTPWKCIDFANKYIYH